VFSVSSRINSPVWKQIPVANKWPRPTVYVVANSDLLFVDKCFSVTQACNSPGCHCVFKSCSTKDMPQIRIKGGWCPYLANFLSPIIVQIHKCQCKCHKLNWSDAVQGHYLLWQLIYSHHCGDSHHHDDTQSRGQCSSLVMITTQ
jgi:hypothetical protein